MSKSNHDSTKRNKKLCNQSGNFLSQRVLAKLNEQRKKDFPLSKAAF